MILWSMILSVETSSLVPYKDEHDKLSEIIYKTTSFEQMTEHFKSYIQDKYPELLL